MDAGLFGEERGVGWRADGAVFVVYEATDVGQGGAVVEEADAVLDDVLADAAAAAVHVPFDAAIGVDIGDEAGSHAVMHGATAAIAGDVVEDFAVGEGELVGFAHLGRVLMDEGGQSGGRGWLGCATTGADDDSSEEQGADEEGGAGEYIHRNILL